MIRSYLELSPEHPPNKPSAALVNVILSLSTHVQELGSLLDPPRVGQRASQLLDTFVVRLLEHFDAKRQPTLSAKFEGAQDLVVLHVLISAWGTQFSSTTTRLQRVTSNTLGEVSIINILS